MEDLSPEKKSKVPGHLKQFLRPPFTTEPVVTQAPYSYAVPPQITPPRSVELCPPHWRLPAKRSLRCKLRSILLKDWQSFAPNTPPRSTSHERPVVMRMKDSDDYITARAANPWTGLISPSIGTDTPRQPWTPHSPGEALQRAGKEEPPSPTPEAKARPALRRANEGRKVSDGSREKWRSGWLKQGIGSTASPKITNANVNAGLISCRSEPTLHEDNLIMHMPSAREPQPYAYSGYSANQIEAFEHYKRKTRRVSSEGYDRRIFSPTRHASFEGKTGELNVRKGPIHDEPTGFEGACDLALNHNASSMRPPNRDITVVKRRIGAYKHEGAVEEGHCYAGAEVNAADFAPFHSPETPLPYSGEGNNAVLETLARVPPYRNVTAFKIHRKPVASPKDPENNPAEVKDLRDLRDINQDGSSSYSLNASDCRQNPTLRHLPRVALVHPALAALPQAHPHRQRVDYETTRKCSLGCAKNPNNICMQRSLPNPGMAQPMKQKLFRNDVNAAGTPSVGQARELNYATVPRQRPQTPWLFEVLVTGAVAVLETCRSVRMPGLPRIRTIDVLKADNASPQQKVDALKTIVSSTGQALVLLTATAIIWQVGSAFAHMLEMLFWPLLVPFKILRWLADSG